jgi:hypothetical protein
MRRAIGAAQRRIIQRGMVHLTLLPVLSLWSSAGKKRFIF